MTRYVALLRGINVGGHKQVSMERLRQLIASLGHEDVVTYLQSGNALFSSSRKDAGRIRSELEERIAADLAVEVKVVMRTGAELDKIIEANPFPDATVEPSKLHVAFLSENPDKARLAALDTSQFEPDQFVAGAGVIYLWYPTGSGRSKLTNDLLERRLGVTATSRNWNTVTKLSELAGGDRT